MKMVIETETKMKDFEIVKEGLDGIIVCSTKTEEETLEWLRLNRPAGTSNNWRMDFKETSRPLQCASHSERKHYYFVC
jgi:hypothetical protein